MRFELPNIHIACCQNKAQYATVLTLTAWRAMNYAPSVLGDATLEAALVEPEAIPDLYADGIQVTTTPFGVGMTFSLREAHPNPTQPTQSEPIATIRMSPEHAKIMAMMLIKQLRAHERDNGISIAIPSSIYTHLGLAEEDWGI